MTTANFPNGLGHSIYQSIMTRRQAEDSAVARQGTVDKVSIDLGMEK